MTTGPRRADNSNRDLPNYVRNSKDQTKHFEVKFILISSSVATAKNPAVGLFLMSRIYRDNHMQAKVLVLVFLIRYSLLNSLLQQISFS